MAGQGQRDAAIALKDTFGKAADDITSKTADFHDLTATASLDGAHAFGDVDTQFGDTFTGLDQGSETVPTPEPDEGAGQAASDGRSGSPPPADENAPDVSEAGVESTGAGDAETAGTDPVDVVSGQLLETTTDVALPGVLPLLMRRAYASGYKHDGLMGPGWSSTADIRLLVDEEGWVRFLGDDAQCLDFGVPAGLRLGLPTYPAHGARWALRGSRAEGSLTVTNAPAGITYRFGAEGAVRPILAITDRNGNEIRFVRDERGYPTGVEHSGGYRLAVSLSETSAGTRIAGYSLLSDDVSVQPVHIVGFDYDEAGRLARVLDAGNAAHCYEWDEQDRIRAWIDRAGYRYPYRYDEVGRVVQTGEAAGFKHALIRYDSDNRTTRVTDALGSTRVYHYDRFQQITKIVDPLGAEVLLHKDPYGRLLEHTDPLGNQTTVEYDADGNPAHVRRADGTDVAYAFHAPGQPIRMTLPGGTTWSYAYDDAGNPLSITDPSGGVTTLAYDEHGAPTQVTEPDGTVRRIENDAAGLPVTVIEPDGARTYARRDSSGRVSRITDAHGASESFSWSQEGRLLARRGRDGAESRYVYDLCGNVVEAHSASGTALFEYGPFNLPRSRTGVDGARYTFTHDAELRLTAVTGPTGLTWNYAFDASGNLIKERDFNGRELAYHHDAAGQLTGKTNAVGQETAYTRDALGRVTERRAQQHTTIFEYDPHGNLVRAEDPDGILEFERDLLGRALGETYQGRTLNRVFDAVGRMTSRITPAGQRTQWDFDTAGRTRQLTAGEHTVEFAHDILGREIERRLSENTALTQSYDPSGRLTGQQLAASGQVVAGREYHYRLDGTPSEVTDLLRGTATFTADPAGRVTAVTADTWSESYAYDELGNLAHAQHPAPADDLDTLGELEHHGTIVRQAGLTRFEHDAQGRLISQVRRTLSGRKRQWSYSWDAQDQLTSVVLPDGTRWRYLYDPLGRRRAKQRLDDHGAVVEQTLFTWDSSRLAEQEHHRPDGAIEILTWDWEPASHRAATQRRTYIPNRADADQDSRRAGIVAAAQAEIDTEFWAIVTDLVGTPRELVTREGRIAWAHRATLWGAPADSPGSAVGQGTDCPLRFPGQYLDVETGLHYNYTRYYDPSTASYLSPDPLGLLPAPNQHGYVTNPLAWADPLGLQPEQVAIDAGTARALSSDDQSVAAGIRQQIGDRTMVMPQTASDEFTGAVTRLQAAGHVSDSEFARAQDLMGNVTVVPDDPSARALGLTVTKKVGANDIQIFGTADKLNIPIFTSDAKFLRGASAQGVDFNAIVHPPMSFLGP